LNEANLAGFCRARSKHQVLLDALQLTTQPLQLQLSISPWLMSLAFFESILFALR